MNTLEEKKPDYGKGVLNLVRSCKCYLNVKREESLSKL